MNRLFCALCVVVFAGCVVEPGISQKGDISYAGKTPVSRKYVSPAEVPAVNPPLEARARNYSNGSCVFASTETAIRWMNNDAIAAAMRSSCRGGSGQARLHENLTRLGVPYVFTSSGSVSFLEWANRTRRACMIFYFPNHAVTFVGMTDTTVYLVDNNRRDHILAIERRTFEVNWKGWGGAATCPLVAPPAPPL